MKNRAGPDQSILKGWVIPSLTRLYPFYRGRGRLALSEFLRARPDEVPKHVRTLLRTGETVYVVENDYIGRMVYFFGDLDPALSDLIRKLVRPGDIVLDIGANIGVVALQLASIVGVEGRVFAFEPIERLSQLLFRSAAENGFENITLFKVALSDTTGRGTMKVPSTSLGCAALSSAGGGEPCDVRLLDEIDFGPKFRRPRLMKIDVEGHEFRVFAGGKAFFNQYPPDYVLFESHAKRGNFWDRPEVRLLSEHGYGFAAILRNVFGKSVLRKIDANDTAFSGSDDFLATKTS